MADGPTRVSAVLAFILAFLSTSSDAAGTNGNNGANGTQAPGALLTPERIVERAIHVCDACHGEGGDSKRPVFPKLAGQPAIYLADQLRAFRSQKRADSSPQAYMWGISALLDDTTIQGLAEYYEAQRPSPGKPGKPALMKKGRRIFENGLPDRNVRACVKCHGDDGEGASVFPRVAGQHADYIVKQLHEFGTKLRPHGVIMATRIVKPMTSEEMEAVAAYLQAKQ